MSKKTIIKIAEYSGRLFAIGAAFLAGWVADKQLDEKISEKIGEALERK